MALEKIVRPHILDLEPYQPGKPAEELDRELGIQGSVKLASNENPLGPSPKAVEAMRRALDGVHRYPDGSSFYLRRALAG
jgi:histidinol-phosphate aminotransferase